MADHSINILVAARDAASGVLSQVGARIRGFASSVFSIRGMLVAGLGGYGLTQILRSSLEAWGEQEQASARLAGVLKATGGAAGWSAAQLEEHASALQKVTTYGDEAILGAQAILATFKSISGDAFKQATESVLDLSAVLGTDLRSTATQVGKALQDPIKGITALRRAGVVFNEEQEKTIKHLAETGRLAEAQAIILAELKGEFGGVARAMGETGTGAMKQFKNALGDVGEEIGKAFTPVLLLMADAASQALPYITAAFQQAGNGIATACAYIKTALDGWALHMDTVKTYTRVFVDAVLREFARLHKQSIQDTSNFLAKFWVTTEGIVTGKTVKEVTDAFKIIDQSYRDYFSTEEMSRLTEAELEHLRAFKEALKKSQNQIALDLPKNLERFSFKQNPFELNMPPDVQDTLDKHAKALRNEPIVSRFLTGLPGASVGVSNKWDKDQKKLGEIKDEAKKHNTLLERMINVIREQSWGGERIAVYAGN